MRVRVVTARRALSRGRHLALPRVVEFFNPINEGPVQPKTAYAASPLIFHASVAHEDHISISKCIPGVAPRVCKNRALSGGIGGVSFFTPSISMLLFHISLQRRTVRFFSPFYFCIDDNKPRIYTAYDAFFLLTTGGCSSMKSLYHKSFKEKYDR